MSVAWIGSKIANETIAAINFITNSNLTVANSPSPTRNQSCFDDPSNALRWYKENLNATEVARMVHKHNPCTSLSGPELAWCKKRASIQSNLLFGLLFVAFPLLMAFAGTLCGKALNRCCRKLCAWTEWPGMLSFWALKMAANIFLIGSIVLMSRTGSPWAAIPMCLIVVPVFRYGYRHIMDPTVYPILGPELVNMLARIEQLSKSQVARKLWICKQNSENLAVDEVVAEITIVVSDVNKYPDGGYVAEIAGAPHPQLEADERMPRIRGPNDRECAICNEGYKTNQILDILPCGHRLHAICAALWFEEKLQCPYCRKDFRYVGSLAMRREDELSANVQNEVA
ncbi:uncharacterized protein AB675_1681 [Cyphellophora attinorum]|uniref:RING-type domain-containing protein n=1 Tax=Cyphellophora attinorum TaxID=1664694 RepID=A0A0N1HMM7_9EURO|nr:uncharacterized protein AB675_1681 [Phialophora attinorum]KPI36060.1 hypothetical protein AB675_1681 [Phialophora attinorum]